MAFTHPTAQKLLTTTSTNAITPPPAYVHDPTLSTSILDFENSDDEDDDRLSSIYLRINTPVVVNGDSNLVAVDPSLSASKIAMAVVSALRQMSMGGSGVPMIDEEGRPRPIKVEITAETKIDGSKNVVGEKAVLAAVGRSDGLKRNGSESNVSSIGRKRQRAQSEPVDEEGKRVRTA